MIMATRVCHLPVLEVLVRAGANLNLQNKVTTALKMCVREESIQVLVDVW